MPFMHYKYGRGQENVSTIYWYYTDIYWLCLPDNMIYQFTYNEYTLYEITYVNRTLQNDNSGQKI